MGRRDIEDGLLRLDTLTKEEGLMVAARTLERTDEIKRLFLPRICILVCLG